MGTVLLLSIAVFTHPPVNGDTPVNGGNSAFGVTEAALPLSTDSNSEKKESPELPDDNPQWAWHKQERYFFDKEGGEGRGRTDRSRSSRRKASPQHRNAQHTGPREC